jgi:DNA-binding response OmpR family regulator
MRLILKEFLTGEGHAVDVAQDGRAGMKLVECNPYDLIITDIVMPEMDGFEVISAIRKSNPQMRIIAMSGGSAKLHREVIVSTASLLCADRAVTKPINLHELKVIVNELLSR